MKTRIMFTICITCVLALGTALNHRIAPAKSFATSISDEEMKVIIGGDDTYGCCYLHEYTNCKKNDGCNNCVDTLGSGTNCANYWASDYSGLSRYRCVSGASNNKRCVGGTIECWVNRYFANNGIEQPAKYCEMWPGPYFGIVSACKSHSGEKCRRCKNGALTGSPPHYEINEACSTI